MRLGLADDMRDIRTASSNMRLGLTDDMRDIRQNS
jgi:hypothetical protein